jgi:hypothetical protein
MKRPGFSISTILLVVILLGAVAYVGSLVNPVKPPEQGHDHEAEQAQTAANTSTPTGEAAGPNSNGQKVDRTKFMKDEQEQRRQMMHQVAQQAKIQTGGSKDASAPTAPMKDPEAIEPTSDILFKSEMGAKGIREQDAEIAEKKKEFKAAKDREKKSPYGIALPAGGVKAAGQVD